MENKDKKEMWKTRALVLRCSDDSFLDLLKLLKGYPDLALVYTKTSDQRLVINEEAF